MYNFFITKPAMEFQTQTRRRHHHQNRHHLSNTSTTTKMVSATVAGAALGGPLLGVMGFSFLATLTLVLVTSPLLLIFSPLLLCAAFVLGGALTGFALAAAMAFAGLCALSWSSREVVKCVQFIGERVEEHGRDFGGHLQQIVHDDNSPEFARLILVE